MRDKKTGVPILLVVLTNVFVLIGVSSNRSGPPDAHLVLTERELSLSKIDDENSGMFLNINWDLPVFNLYNARHTETEYLDQEKLDEFGWDCPLEIRDTQHPCYHYRSSVKAYIVLEFGGEPWEKWLESQKKELESKQRALEKAENKNSRRTLEEDMERIRNIPTVKSRLFAVDFSPDPLKLRARYPDPSRFIILPGLIRMYYNLLKKEPANKDNRVYRLRASINDILINKIYVPDEFHEFFETQVKAMPSPFTSYGFVLHKITPDTRPRFQATVNFGKRYEPWIESVALFQ